VCTLVVRKDARRVLPLVVAANRDELRTRPAAPVQVLFEEPVRAIGGLDLEAGGTWMGATRSGLFVGLTNQRSFTGPVPGLRSRGEVVLEALQRGSVDGVDGLLADLDGRRYNGFNLLYGDVETLRVAYARPSARAVEVRTLPDGHWVLPNDRIGSPEFPKADRALHLLAPLAGEDRWPVLEAGLTALLADSTLPATLPPLPPGVPAPFTAEEIHQLQALNIRLPAYGTRSSTVVALDAAGRVAHYLYADGPPHDTPFEERAALLA
jgi:uncharacterized protein with NRDE domain